MRGRLTSVASAENHTVAIAVPRTAEQYSRPIVRGIVHTLNNAGVNTLCISGWMHQPRSDRGQSGYDCIQAPMVRDVITLGGLMFHTSGSAEHFAELYPDRRFFNIGSEMRGAPVVMADNASGMRQAVEHLAALGRRRIAFVRGPTFSTDAAERYRGYRRGLESCNLSFDPALISPGEFILHSGRKAVELFFDTRGVLPDAIVAANDSTACGVLLELKRRGLRVPDDIAVVGFDNVLDAAACDPPLTTVAQPLVEQGVRAAELVLAVCRGEPVPDRVCLPTEVIVRASCGGQESHFEPPNLPEISIDAAEWLKVHGRVVADWARRRAGWSTLELEPISKLLAALFANGLEAQAVHAVQQATDALPTMQAWRGLIALYAVRHALSLALPKNGPLRQRIHERLRSSERRLQARVESEEARQTTISLYDQANSQALSRSLLSARSNQIMVERLARQLGEHPLVRGYHLTYTEPDPKWSRLVKSSEAITPHSGRSTRFLTRTLLPDGTLPRARPFNLCAAQLGTDAECAGALFLDVVPEYLDRTGLLAEQIMLWLSTQRRELKSAASEDLPDGMPEWIGRYEVQRRIGTGGMASVYLASTQVAGVTRPVAIKLLHAESQASGKTEQLMEEARLAASVRHPNVVQVLELGEYESGVFLVMDFVEGCNLARLLGASQASQRRIPRRVVGRILVDGLGGLQAAHELHDPDGFPVGLVHRDISLQNILVGVDGVTRITDFGIAKTLSQGEATEDGVLRGKLRYMAPEQILGQEVDQRADLWSMAVVAWELLTNQRLYDGDREAILSRRFLSEAPPRLSSVCQVHPALDELIARTLSLNPEDRPGSAKELRRLLVRIFEEEDGLADAEEVGSYVREQIDKAGLEVQDVAHVTEVQEK